MVSYFYAKSGRDLNKAKDHGVKFFSNSPYGNLKYLSSSLINYLNYPMWANKPSGTRTVPNSLPCFHLKTITSAISLTTSYKVSPLSLISSLISTTLG